MSVAALFLALAATVALCWLLRQGVLSRPWLEEGEAVFRPEHRASAATVGLGVFLAVVSALFALLASAYLTRMAGTDWRPPPAPAILFVNTAILAASSGAMQIARGAAANGERERLETALAGAAVLAFLFLIGQLSAWTRLIDAGYLASTNPANAFFYLLTGLHGAHLIGGLAALLRTTSAVWRGADARAARASVDLCAIYWHFMLLVWLGIFALLAGWASAHPGPHG